MKCRENVERIAEICAELLDIVDDSREHCDNDECELVHCVVHDCVQKMRRVLTNWNPDAVIDVEIHVVGSGEAADGRVN